MIEKEDNSPRYGVLREIGRGAFGVVFLANDRRLKRQVAIKVLNTPQGLNEEERQRFLDRFHREAQAAAGLTHPNIVVIHDVSRAKNKHFISMEYLEGQPLDDVIAGGPIEFKRALGMADQILSGLDYAHSHGVIHRDIKPENIFLLSDGTIKLVDFGLARVVTTTTITKSGTVLGTPGYISPEVIKAKGIDKRSDIFSFGVVLYEMLTGKRPFGPEDAFDTMVNVIYRIISEEPEPPSSVNAAVPREMDLIVAKCLAKDPAKRYQSAEMLRRHLSIASGTGDAPGGSPAREPGPGPRGVSVLEEALAQGASISDTPLPVEETDEEGRGFVAVPTKTPLVIRPPKVDEEAGAEAQPSVAAEPTVTPVQPQATPVQPQAVPETGAAAVAAAATEPDYAYEPRRWLTWKKFTLFSGGAAVIVLAVLFLLGMLPGPWAKAKVPELKGKTVEQAEKALESAGLKMGEKTESFSNDVENGQVISADPSSGSGVEKSSSVAVVFSKGRETIAVPDVANKVEAEASGELEGSGLTLIRHEEPSDTVPAGTIIRQDPRPGTVLANGTAVTIVVSLGPAQPAAEQPPPPAQDDSKQYVTCSTCGGAGNIGCSSCGGSGQKTTTVTCGRCGGSGVDPDGGVCTACGGSGGTTTTVTCSTCGGSGRTTCPTCGGSGKVLAFLRDLALALLFGPSAFPVLI